MKKAYIITMHCPLNYGAILQTYAFQTYLESLGLEVEIIDYRPKFIVKKLSLMYVGGDQYKKNFLTRWAYRFFKAPSKIYRRMNFSKFGKNELHLTSKYDSSEEIKKANLKADVFFCGSDQIWNEFSGANTDPAYFLDFVKNGGKKASYAASGNLPITDEVKYVTFPMINKLDCISMREHSTIESIQPFISKPITHVCDPVFLLCAEKWRLLYKKQSSFPQRERYVLAYPMGNGVEATIQKASELAKQLCLPLYLISDSQRKDSRAKYQLDVDPYKFLFLLDNATYIVTNSFHGTSFSIIFRKQFWACVAEGSNQRITSLLEKAGLERRLLIGNAQPDISDIINFDLAKNSLVDYIQVSKQFIMNCINEV